MKIQLHNFRCYTNATFEIPDQGLILLSGESGAGKSTLLKAILYALYGSKAIRKPYSFGTQSCTVKLDFVGLQIQRSNRPNRLLVNDLEDDPAQEYINQRLMGYNEFCLSSYIPQKNNTSILSLPQTEQVQLIKTIALDPNKNEIYKKRLKEMLQQSGQAVLEKQTAVSIIQETLDNFAQIPAVECPFDDNSNSQQLVKEFQQQRSQIMKQLTQLIEEQQLVIQQRQELSKQLHAFESRTRSITEIENRLSENKLQQKRLKELIGTRVDSQTLADLQAQLLAAELNQNLQQLQIEDQTERDQQLQNVNAQLANYDSLDNLKQQLEQMDRELQSWQAYQTSARQLAKLKKKLSQQDNCQDMTRKELEEWCRTTIFESQLYSCPECKTVLKCDSGQLTKVPKGHKPQKANCQDLEKILKEIIAIPDVVQPVGDREKLQILAAECSDQFQIVADLEKQLENLNRPDPQIKKLQQKLGGLPKPTQSFEKLQDTVKKLTTKQSEQKVYQKELQLIQTEERKLQKKLQDQKLIEPIDPDLVNELAVKEESLTTEIKHLKGSPVADPDFCHKVDSWVTWSNQQDEIQEWELKLVQAQKEVQKEERKHLANQRLKKRYTQAEVMALEETIKRVNEYTRYYLDTFFADQQLAAILRTVQQKKTGDLKIDTLIYYKGYEYDTINQLSGGEFDRCTLASICGINAMLQSPILILDECLASLDSNNNTEIIRFLSELAQEKLILVCSHEAVQGIFDQRIQL
jgi:DNA repair exonuclease SbcCD ATPase subunit